MAAGLCKYLHEDGQPCGRQTAAHVPYCLFHMAHGVPDDVPEQVLADNAALFAQAFGPLLEAGDGDWRGFIFPRGFKFPDAPRELAFGIRATNAEFNELELADVIFKEEVDFSETPPASMPTPSRRCSSPRAGNSIRRTAACPAVFSTTDLLSRASAARLPLQ